MHSEGIGTQRAAGDGHVTNLIPIDAHVLVIDESKADPGGLAGSDDGLVDPDGGGHGAVLSQWGEDYADARLNVGRRVAVTVPLLWTGGLEGFDVVSLGVWGKGHGERGCRRCPLPTRRDVTTTCTADNRETNSTAPEYSVLAAHHPGACC